MLEIQLEGEGVSPHSIVGKWLTDDLFKASGADQIKITSGGECVLLVGNHPAYDNNSEAWQQYVREMKEKGWIWFASWSYMAFISAQQTLAVDGACTCRKQPEWILKVNPACVVHGATRTATKA